MATLGSSYLTLIDLYKRREGPDAQIATIIEILKQMNPVLDDSIAIECNMGTIHRHTIRTGLPFVTWGMLYKGIPQSKSNTQQVDDTTGFVEALSTIDSRLLKLSANEGALRLSEAKAFLEAMNQEMASGIFYHDTVDTPERFKGLAARYNVYADGINNLGAQNQVINGGGTGSDNTSIWFVTWGDQYTSLLYPKGTKAGIEREDMGQQRVTDEAGNAYYVKEEKFTWHIGMAIKDWRYNARVANISTAGLTAGTVDLYKLMTSAYYRLQSRRVAGGKQAIYMNRFVMEALDNLATGVGAAANSKLHISRREVQGEEVLHWRGIPIRETDALLNTEAPVPKAA